jgi:stage II sporulation protein D
MRRALLPIAALLAIAVPASADAATRFVVRGAGWGHGIGMSQYGAYGYALEGRGYRSILSHYYSGTRLTKAAQRSVRVLLQPDDPYIRVRGATRASGGKRLSPSKTYVARPSGGRISLFTSSGKRVGRFSSGLRLERPGGVLRLLGPALNGVRDGRYRGAVEILANGGLDAINVLSLDDYVRGVVAGEMPGSWPLEALKAQAVTARTYALATRKPGGDFDLYPDTRSQVYRGVAAEGVRSNSAVSGTAGKILTYGGEPAVTYYFSTSGGHTESIQYSFVGSLSKPWLVGVTDPYDFHSPYHRWRAAFTAKQLTRALGARGTFRKLRVLKRGTSPRIVRAQVVGSRGTTTVSGPTIRSALGLRDTWARFTRVSTAARAAHGAPVGRAAVASIPPAPASIHGSLDPAPKGGRLAIERRVDGRWLEVRTIRMGAHGRYRADLGRAGVYRVRSGVIAGPAVRVR